MSYNDRIEEDGVGGSYNYGKCAQCGGSLPNNCAEGYCPECEEY